MLVTIEENPEQADPQLYTFLQEDPQPEQPEQLQQPEHQPHPYIKLSEEDLWRGLEVFTDHLLDYTPPEQVSVVNECYHSNFEILAHKLKWSLHDLTQIAHSTESIWEKIDFESQTEFPNSFILESLKAELTVLGEEFDETNQFFQTVSAKISVLNLKFDYLLSLIKEMSD